jgi:hypothetical protein
MVPSTAFLAICAGVSGIWNTLEAPSLQPSWQLNFVMPIWLCIIALLVKEVCLWALMADMVLPARCLQHRTYELWGWTPCSWRTA